MEKQTMVDGERLKNGENDCQTDTWVTRQITMKKETNMNARTD